MPMRTYAVARHDAPNDFRKGYIVTFARDGQPPLDVALHRTARGYLADHPRSGYSIGAFDQVSHWGKPVTLAEAKDSLMMLLDEMKGYERIREGCKALHVLNPAFR